MKNIILEGYFNMLIMIGHIGMLWWVSTSVMCIALIKHTMNYNQKHYKLFYTKGICALICLFFLSIIGYGLYMAKSVIVLKEKFLFIIGYDNFIECPIDPIFSIICAGYLIGTSSFVLALVAWFYVLYSK